MQISLGSDKVFNVRFLPPHLLRIYLALYGIFFHFVAVVDCSMKEKSSLTFSFLITARGFQPITSGSHLESSPLGQHLHGYHGN